MSIIAIPNLESPIDRLNRDISLLLGIGTISAPCPRRYASLSTKLISVKYRQTKIEPALAKKTPAELSRFAYSKRAENKFQILILDQDQVFCVAGEQ